MFRGVTLTRVAALIALLALSMPVMAATTPVEPKGPQPICGTPLLADLAAQVLAKVPPAALGKPLRAPRGIPVGGKETFWAMDMVHNTPFQLQATLKKISKHAYMYVQDGYDVDEPTIAKLAHQFDEVIWPTDHAYFGHEYDPGIDGDSRVTLLFMDIVDGWTPGRGYVAGYFFPLDEVSTSLYPYSNEREMFYLDLYPGDPRRDDYLGVLAHEFQHMIHFAHDPRETRWLNESLSQLAFFVCGYGHAPQIFQFIHDTNSNFVRFDNTLEDYGRSYLFLYYLFSHYAGNTVEARQSFTRDLVASKLTGPASISQVLKDHGVTKSLEQIKADWFLANVMNPSKPADPNLGYDDSLRFSVQSAKLYDLASLPEGDVSTTVMSDAAKYFTVDTKVRYTPDHPTMVDHVKIYSDAPGNLLWNVNGNALPPARLIPSGSTTTQDNWVSTPLAKDGCCFSTKLGTFARLGTVISKINYKLPDAKTSKPLEVPIFSLASVASAGARQNSKFTFNFQGDKKALWTVDAIQFAADGSAKLSPVDLDAHHAGAFTTQLTEGYVTFMVRALNGDKKGVRFTYSIKPAAAANDLTGLVKAGARLASIDTRLTLGDVSNDAAAKAQYGDLLKAREQNVTALASKLASDPEAAEQAARLIAGAEPAEKDQLNHVLKDALKRAKFEALDGGQVSEALKQAVLTANGKSDDQDDAHDNIRYLIQKKNENIHGLTHLKIDPQFLEGQLLTLWKLLEIARGFPHLPIPDGFGIVEYNEQKAKDLLGQWATDFGVPGTGTFPPKVRPVVKNLDLEKVKTVVRRLILAESIIQFAYDNGLILAENTAVSVYEIVRLLLCGHQTIVDISKHFENVPIVGPVAKALRARILGKLLGVAERFGVYLSARLKPPYNGIAPTIIMVVANVTSRVLGANIDPQYPNMMKELGVKLFGKYALTSIPKIGFVARSQSSIDLATEYASNLTANGSLEDAVKKVWDDGNSDTSTSVREIMADNIIKRTKLTEHEREIANIATLIARIAAYGSVIDPTNITRVVGIVAGVAAGGLLAHSTWNNASYYFQLPKHEMLNGVRWAYDPAATELQEASTLKRSRPNAAFNGKLYGELKSSFDNFQSLAKEVLAAAEVQNKSEAQVQGLMRKVDALMKADAQLDLLSGKCEAIALAGGTFSANAETEAEDLYKATQGELMRRTTVLSDALVRVAGKDPGPSVALASGPDKYLAMLKTSLDRVAASSEGGATAAAVSRSSVKKSGDQLVITAVVSNLSDDTITNIDVRLVSGLDFTITDGPEVRRIESLAGGDEQEVQFTIRMNETKPIVAPQLAVVAEAEGVNILPKFQGLP